MILQKYHSELPGYRTRSCPENGCRRNLTPSSSLGPHQDFLASINVCISSETLRARFAGGGAYRQLLYLTQGFDQFDTPRGATNTEQYAWYFVSIHAEYQMLE